MATVYTFLVKNAGGVGGGTSVADSNGMPSGKKGAGSRIPFFTGSNRGVEHNRYMRALNPIINRYTGGMWEKGNRLFRAGTGMIDTWKSQGAMAALTGVGSVLIIQFALMEAIKAIEKARKDAKEDNQANYFKIKNGSMLLGQDFSYSKTLFGKINYAVQ